MKQFARAVLVLSVCLLAGCEGLIPPGSPENVEWPQVVECLGIPDKITAVSELLLRGGSADEWEELGRREGAKGIRDLLCATEQVVHDWSQPGAATSPEGARALELARRYLEETGTRVER